MPQTGGLFGVAMQRKRRRLGPAQHFHFAIPDLHSPGQQIFIDSALRPLPHHPRYPQHILRTHINPLIHHALNDSRMVAQIHERQMLPMLPAPVGPPAHADPLPRQPLPYLPAIMRAHPSCEVLGRIGLLCHSCFSLELRCWAMVSFGVSVCSDVAKSLTETVPLACSSGPIMRA